MKTSYVAAEATRGPEFAQRAVVIAIAVLLSVLALVSGGNAIVALLPLLSGTALLTSGRGKRRGVLAERYSHQVLRAGSPAMPSARRTAVAALVILSGICAATDTMVGGLIATFLNPSAHRIDLYWGILFVLAVPAYIADIRSERSFCLWMLVAFACRWMAACFADSQWALANPLSWPNVPMGVLLFFALASGQASKWVRSREFRD
jgi:hypothetical protein